VFDRIQRLRTVSNQALLHRGTVRRGGFEGSILKFGLERKNMVLHIFSFESEAKQSGPEEKAWRRKSREERDGCEEIIGRGPRELARLGKEPVYAARTVLLRWNASSGARETTASGTLEKRSYTPEQSRNRFRKVRGCSPKRGWREWAIRTARRSSRDITRPPGRRFYRG
jgi:hypothetical protein